MKSIIKKKFPLIIKIYKLIKMKLQKLTFIFRSNESIFSEIYEKNLWGSGESRSGIGSELTQTEAIREELPKLFKDLRISSLLDIPCGDFYWLRKVNLDFLSYIGADIVEELISTNKKNYSSTNKKFIKLDITKDRLPKVDLILCRDILFHFSFKDILQSIKNIKESGSKYLLCTSNINVAKNKNIVTGAWRPLNLQIPPIMFPEPIRIIHEKSTNPQDADKSLLLWKISDL